MKCPYCNKKLQLLYDNINVFRCSNTQCKKSIGMAGTPEMWEKVAQIVKIRNAGKRYIAKNSQTEEYKKRKRETALRWYHKHKKEKQDARN